MKNIKCAIRSDAKRKDKERSIYVRYTYNRRFLLFNTGTSVSRDDWNKNIGRIRKSANYEESKSTNYEEINSILTKQERYIEAIVLKLISQNQEPTLLEVKSEYYKSKNPTQSNVIKPKKQDETLFLKDFKEFIDYQTDNKIVAKQTYKTYNTTYNKLASFQSDILYPLHYNTISNEFYDKFLLFLRNQGLADNSVDKHIKNTKLFMSWALSKEKHTNNVFHTFKRTRTKAYFVVLDDNELRRLYYEYKTKDLRKSQIRDAFIFGCSTGLRFGDLTKLTRGNFHISRDKRTNEIIPTAADSYIDVHTEKTNFTVRIPLNNLLCELIEKYEIEKYDPAFLKYNSQLFNREIKDICREAGIKEQVKIFTKRETGEQYREGQKCDYVSSHTMRRTFITLLSTMTQISNIQAVSGHKDIKVLSDYIKRSDRELNAVMGCMDVVFYRGPNEKELPPSETKKVRIAIPSIIDQKVRVAIIGTQVMTSDKK